MACQENCRLEQNSFSSRPDPTSKMLAILRVDYWQNYQGD
jgi:hypothetical protein